MKEKPKGLPSLWWQALAVEAFTQQSARPYREADTSTQSIADGPRNTNVHVQFPFGGTQNN